MKAPVTNRRARAFFFLAGLGLVFFSPQARPQSFSSPPAHASPLAHAESWHSPTPGRPDFEGMARQQTETDKVWRAASEGRMLMEKITYRSRAMDIPAFVFQPIKPQGPGSRPAIVWVHEDIRGHLYEHYIPYIREATAKGYIVIAPGVPRRHRLRTGVLRCDRLRRRRGGRRGDGC